MTDLDAIGMDVARQVVFVLGAGFSRAISSYMPLTDELGAAALEKLRGDLPPRLALDELPRSVNFEAWLSELAGDQPYLSDAENAQNHAAFLMFSQAIADILGDRVDRVLRQSYPEWLLALVSAWHHSRATVITFNYDPLVECFVQTPTRILGDPNHYGQVWNGVNWTELSGGLPAWAPGDARLASTRVDTFRLLKLHGSLNWYWRAGDESGVSVARRSLPGHFGNPAPYTDEDRRREVPGRTPFVVPPAAAKSQYYANPITKEMWSQAYERLQAADRLFIVGYSLPATDTTFSNMLRLSLQSREVEVVVSDFAPSPVVERLMALGIEPGQIRIAGEGKSAVPSLVDEWAGALSVEALRVLASIEDQDTRLLLAWGDSAAYAPVERVDTDGSSVAARFTRVYSSFNLATGINSRPAVSIAFARDQLAGSAAAVQFHAESISDTHRGPIVKVVEASTATGQGEGQWLVLQVAAAPPQPDH